MTAPALPRRAPPLMSLADRLSRTARIRASVAAGLPRSEAARIYGLSAGRVRTITAGLLPEKPLRWELPLAITEAALMRGYAPPAAARAEGAA